METSGFLCRTLSLLIPGASKISVYKKKKLVLYSGSHYLSGGMSNEMKNFKILFLAYSDHGSNVIKDHKKERVHLKNFVPMRRLAQTSSLFYL